MAILRNRTQMGFTIIDNYALMDKRLSLKSVGLLVKMLSLPDKWDFSEAGLVSIVKDGQSSVRSGLKELERFGYLVRRRVKDESGKFTDCEWEVYAAPVEKPQVENPNMDTPNLDSADNITTKGVTTKESSTSTEKPKEPKRRYGEYANVLLTDSDLSKLKSEFPNDWQQRIDRLSEYMECKGAKYKNHLATIRSWARNEKQDGRGAAQEPARRETFEERQRKEDERIAHFRELKEKGLVSG